MNSTEAREVSPPAWASRAWYEAPIEEFLKTLPEIVVGQLGSRSSFAVLKAQSLAWLEEVCLLQRTLPGIRGRIFLEFTIPRIGRRIDAVIIVNSVVIAVEFKVGAEVFEQAAVEQVWDYALDLKNFHEGSHAVAIMPVLVATDAEPGTPLAFNADDDGVFRPIRIGATDFRGVIDKAVSIEAGPVIEPSRWAASAYKPTPTIIEAARALYANHSVENIARSDAGAINLHATSSRIDQIVDMAMAEHRKVICFVTGVPGAGKTLVGLNVATRHRRELGLPTHAVYLSGNGPLVAVLSEVLTRDALAHRRANGDRVRKSEIKSSVKAFIQNVHHFRDEGLREEKPPHEHVVIFDEAQRAWNARQTANFLKNRKGITGVNVSEPELLISYMDRHHDWAVVVCLVGGGQEINVGEAGIDAWLDAIASKFPDWLMFISSRLSDSEYAAGRAIEGARDLTTCRFDDSLHLAVSMRSFRAENVSAFVKSLIDCEVADARRNLAAISASYPIVLSRDLREAKEWVRSKARGSERYGLVASSKAQRLKPHAIDIRVSVDPVQWFLKGRDDTRSSYFLEDAATEFQVQGLELDWACVTWDGDLRFNGNGWSYHDFRGSRWTNIKSPENRNYLRNAYRVLLTRARQGMVVFVPRGDSEDQTRSPEYYDATFNYLKGIGIPAIKESAPGVC